MNPVTNTIYVADQTSGTVSVIDGSTNSVVASPTVGSNPDAVAVNTVTNMVYAANFDSNGVSVTIRRIRPYEIRPHLQVNLSRRLVNQEFQKLVDRIQRARLEHQECQQAQRRHYRAARQHSSLSARLLANRLGSQQPVDPD